METLKRKYIVNFTAKMPVPIEEKGEFSAAANIDIMGAKDLFLRWMKKDHPEITDVVIKSFEVAPAAPPVPDSVPQPETNTN